MEQENAEHHLKLIIEETESLLKGVISARPEVVVVTKSSAIGPAIALKHGLKTADPDLDPLFLAVDPRMIRSGVDIRSWREQFDAAILRVTATPEDCRILVFDETYGNGNYEPRRWPTDTLSASMKAVCDELTKPARNFHDSVEYHHVQFLQGSGHLLRLPRLYKRENKLGIKRLVFGKDGMQIVQLLRDIGTISAQKTDI
jgi:hypothetical protein